MYLAKKTHPECLHSPTIRYSKGEVLFCGNLSLSLVLGWFQIQSHYLQS